MKFDEMCTLAYELGASGIILGEVMPSGRSFLNPEIMMTREQRNILSEKIISNIQKYSGRMTVQRSSPTKIQLIRYMNTPNTGAIIRPNGDIRLDCSAPFVIVDILPITKVRGFWSQQTLHSCECLTGSPPMADAPTIFYCFYLH